MSTRLRCGGIFRDNFIADLLLGVRRSEACEYHSAGGKVMTDSPLARTHLLTLNHSGQPAGVFALTSAAVTTTTATTTSV